MCPTSAKQKMKTAWDMNDIQSVFVTHMDKSDHSRLWPWYELQAG